MSLIHIYLCPLCYRPVAVEDFLHSKVHTLTDYVLYQVTDVVFDKAASGAEIKISVFLHRECNDIIMNSLKKIISSVEKPIFSAPEIHVVSTEQERLVLAVASREALLRLVELSHFVIFDKITLDVPRDVQMRYGIRKTFDEIVDELVSLTRDPSVKDVVRDAVRALGYDPNSPSLRARRDLVEHGVALIHLLLLTQAGLIRVLVDLNSIVPR